MGEAKRIRGGERYAREKYQDESGIETSGLEGGGEIAKDSEMATCFNRSEY